MPARLPPSPIRFEGDLAYVTLTNGVESIFDAEDAHLLGGMRCNMIKSKRINYVSCKLSRRSPHVALHRLVLGRTKIDGYFVDHIDHDGLNNRKSNLRLCNIGQNNANMRRQERTITGFKGVYEGSDGLFCAGIRKEGKCYFLGSYPTKEEASAAYMGAAKILWGEFAFAG